LLLDARRRLIYGCGFGAGPVERANMFENLDGAKRIELAKVKMEKVLDHFLYLLELHANNALVVYSPILSSQIPPSFAANAFNVFQRSMHQFEIVRLCALWDGPDAAKENIPTVIELIDDDAIIDTLAEETRQHRARDALQLFNAADDPKLNTAEREAVKRAELEFADEQASRAETELRHAIAEARDIFGSPRLASVMNIRDKHLAHALETTRREKRGPVVPMKYGDETALLDQSAPIVEQLFCWVNGKSFSIDDSRRIDEENASSLWHGCKFENLD
jgi:AbiU2